MADAMRFGFLPLGIFLKLKRRWHIQPSEARAFVGNHSRTDGLLLFASAHISCA
jgi:hypothetical protein